MTPRKKKAPKAWSKTVGDDSPLTAIERTDRGGEIWTRRWDRERKKYVEKKYLFQPIRIKGEIDAELENAAIAALIRRQKAIAADVADKSGPLTLARAVQLFLHPTDGSYPSDSAWKGEVKSQLNHVVRILGGAFPVEQIRHQHYRKLWRTLAQEYRDNDQHGPRACEMICGSFRKMVTWLQQEELVEAGTGLPAPRWKAAMKEEWVEISGKPIPEPNRPRYSDEETIKLWKALHRADPRLAMMMEEGAELRLGQVRRAFRSNMFAYDERLEDGSVVHHAIGGVNVIGRGKKRGGKVLFTPKQRAYVTEQMTTGYLSELERAFQAGEISDYRLTPGEFLARGKAQIKNAMAEPSDRALRNWWHDLEELAGVEHVKGRGWYGERRRRIQNIEKDTKASPTAKNRASGHTKTDTREIYVGTMDDTFLVEAMEVKKRTRPDVN